MVFFGEVGLSGAVRPVPHANLRLKEATKLGFARAVAPQGLQDQGPQEKDRPERNRSAGMAMRPIRHIGEAIADIASLGRNSAPKPVRAAGSLSRRAQKLAL